MITSNRSVSVILTGNIDSSIAFNADENLDSPGMISLYDLTAGVNTITLPTAAIPVAATIVPPALNVEGITLKGIAADTGIQIHPTDPTVLTFDPDALPASFVLVADDDIDGLTIIWS